MSAHYPNAFILDLGSAVKDYRQSVEHCSHALDTDPHEMIGWLTGYLSDKECADDEVSTAVWDFASCDDDTDPQTLECFVEAAMQLGLSIVSQINRYGLFARDEGGFPFDFVRLIDDRSALFTHDADRY